MQNAEKYVGNEEPKPEKPVAPEEGVQELFDPKPEEPEKQTLEEYYRAKGIDLTYAPTAKALAKRGEVEAEWIKKEKLTLLTTKEELKAQERRGEQAVKVSSSTVGLDIAEEDMGKLGFGKKKQQSREEEHHKKGKKAHKPHFTADDFPSL